MRGTILVSTLASLALLAQLAPARARESAAVNRRTGLFEPPVADLRKAAERGDRAELARAAGRLGPARLTGALADPDRRVVLAVLESIPLLPAGILLLDAVVPLSTGPDPAIREWALRTLAALLGGGPDRLAEWEIPTASARAACRALAAAAANESETTASRLVALQGLADAGSTCAGSAKPALLLTSRAPEIRRAAVLALPAEPAANEALLAAARDPDGRVAAAAGARLCARRAKARALAGEPPLHVLALAEGAAPEDVLDMLPCLLASKDPADQKAIATLRETGPRAIRDACKAAPAKQP
jgi:hypothetical protein